jgi:hypothetical protein
MVGGIDALGGLLDLRVRRPPNPPACSPDGAAVERWHDRNGRLAGYGHAEEGWLHLLGVGTFSFGPGKIEVDAQSGVGMNALEDAHRRLALPLVLAALGHQVLHGSAVSMPAGVVALCATSGAGKSTLAYGFTRRGLLPVADDAVALDASTGAPVVVPLPFALRLRPRSREHFSLNGAPASQPEVPADRLPLAAICTLERMAADAPRVNRLSPSEAFPAVLAHAYSFGLADPSRRQRMVDAYLRLASLVPVFRVTVPDGLDTLDSTLDAVERGVAAAAS